MFRVLIAGNKPFIDEVANSYENRDIVAMLCGDGELSLAYHTFDSLPSDWTEYDALIMSAEDAKKTFDENPLNDRTADSSTMSQMLITIFIAGQMDVNEYVNVEVFDDHGDILRYIMETLL